MATHEERLANLESALSLLAQLSVPVAVGDFPDMSPAIGLMLGESQVPNPGTLVALNERLHAWAQGRDQVLILPLAKSVLDVRADRGFKIGNETWPAGRASGLIQLDRLHPTLEGMCVLGAMIGHGLVEAGWAESGAFAPASEVLASLRVPVRAAENVMEDR